ncbi:MAG: site-specific integrase [Chloroflexi bacterium]|nr:site-specific integrase [Chloroflexota bacterium]
MRGSVVDRNKSKRGQKGYKPAWAVVLELPRGADGRRRQQWTAVKGTRKDAEAKLTELLHQADTGYALRPEKVTVQEALSLWLRDHAQRVRPRTLDGYESKLRYSIYPALGRMALRDLQPAHVQAVYRDLLGKVSARTVKHVHTVLQQGLDYAVTQGYISRNPCKTLTPPKPGRKEMRAMSPKEANAVLEAARATPYYGLFHMALYTGLRRSELLGLRVRDVDLTLGTLHVARGMHVLHGGVVTYAEPKSAKGKRTVALTPGNAVVLREHLVSLEAGMTALGVAFTDDTPVFSWPDGRPMLPDSVSHAWVNLIERLGMSRICLHDARHTHASIMLAQGVHPKVVQERLGHSTIAITLDVYSHVAPGLQAAAALAFDKMLAPDPLAEKAPANIR